MDIWQYNRGWDDIEGLVRLLKKEKRNRKDMASVRNLFLMIAYCRDMVRGKGERDLSYRMIYAFYQVFPILAIKAVHLLFSPRITEGLSSVGSWCDIKRFCVFIERIASAQHPLIEVVASIANRQLDQGNSSVAKWIPRECHHPRLFSIFAHNWARKRLVSGVIKKTYRKVVSELGSSWDINHVWFMGDYVRDAIRVQERGDKWDVIDNRWKGLLRTFPWGFGGIALIDIDVSISDESLYHAIGYGIFIALKMGSKRILLMGVEPLWVDLSVCSGFVEMVKLVWSLCEIRGSSRYEGVWSLLSGGMKFVFDEKIRVFVFSERFSFSWSGLCESVGSKGHIVFWNLGFHFDIPPDFYLEDSILIGNTQLFDIKKNCVYMSGYSPGLLMRFFENDSSYDISNLYTDWANYFDLFVLHIGNESVQ